MHNITHVVHVDENPMTEHSMVFFRIPVLFATLNTFGRVLSIMFFLCLSFAGVTSLISNMELVAHTLEDFGGMLH